MPPALFALLVLLQIVPLPAELVQKISPARPLSWTGLDGLGAKWMTLSIYRHDTLLAFGKLLAYLGAFGLAPYVFDSRKRKSLLVSTLIALGAFEAMYGTIQYLTGWQKIFTYSKVVHTTDGTGTYINHNHFAGLLEITIPLTIASVFYCFQLWAENRRVRGHRRGPARVNSTGVQALIYLFSVVLMVVGAISSRSRGGILAVMLSVVFVALLAQLKTKRALWALGLFLFMGAVVGRNTSSQLSILFSGAPLA